MPTRRRPNTTATFATPAWATPASRTGAVGTNTFTSHNFNFNNVIVNASITSDGVGTNNYFSQNYQAGGSLSTVANPDAYFNSTDVSSNLFLQDGNSGLMLVASNARHGQRHADCHQPCQRIGQ